MDGESNALPITAVKGTPSRSAETSKTILPPSIYEEAPGEKVCHTFSEHGE